MMRKLLSKYGIQSSVAKELRMVTIDHRWYFSRFAPNKSYKIMFLIHSGLEDFVAYNSWRRFIVTNSLCCILTTKLIPIKVVRKAKLTSLHQINNLHSWLTSHHGHPKTPEWQWTAPKSPWPSTITPSHFLLRQNTPTHPNTTNQMYICWRKY